MTGKWLDCLVREKEKTVTSATFDELLCFALLQALPALSNLHKLLLQPHPSTMYVPFQQVFTAGLVGVGIMKEKKGEVISEGKVLDYCG